MGERDTTENAVDRLALFSDIHGNRAALEAVLVDLGVSGVSRLYCLGDLVGYGADPNGVIDLLRDRGIPSILGNYDEGVAWETGDCGCFFPDARAREIGTASYSYTVSTVTSDRKAFLRGLPRELHLTLADKTVHLVHGSPRRINEYLLRGRDERTYHRLAAHESDDVLAFGHTHDPWARRFGDTLFVNVGSVGKPKDGDPRAACVVLSSGPRTEVTVEIRRVDYDVERAAREIIAAGLPSDLADALRTGL